MRIYFLRKVAMSQSLHSSSILTDKPEPFKHIFRGTIIFAQFFKKITNNYFKISNINY